MLKNRLIEIVTNLIHVTKSGILKWVEDNPESKSRDYKRKMTSIGEDGTGYEIEIKFHLRNDQWQIDDSPQLWIKSESLPDNMFLITNYKCDNEINNLRDAILENFCQDMNPSIKDVEDALGKIAKGINISEFREGRLNKILNK